MSDNEREGNYPKEKIPREEPMISQSETEEVLLQQILFYSALVRFNPLISVPRADYAESN